ncbi:MAG: hypothetical protein KBC74_00990 [Candidatus Pacebacteria bacterium]|nr:hypothetical protein [Candidatus Paceibacterota bacterium]MBP9832089.1 hypothetical protein [Candidatus Paceibacterota bacterium]
MNRQNILTLVLAVATLALIGFTGTLYFLAQVPTPRPNGTSPINTLPGTNSQVGSNTPVVGNTRKPSQNTLEIASSNDGSIFVRDFTKDIGVASTTPPSSFLSWFPNSEVATTSAESTYEIFYSPEGTFFIVVILKEPIGEVRRSATKNLIEKLGISNADVCTLVADVNIPYFVNEFYSGKNLGFPGCSGAEKFEGD